MKVSKAEAQILELLWQAGQPVPADTVIEMIGDDADWSPATVRTFLTRLVKKGAAAAAQEGRRYLYSPLLDRDDYVHQESRGLIDRLFGGKVSPLFAQLAEREDLTAEDIAELKAMIERIEDGR